MTAGVTKVQQLANTGIFFILFHQIFFYTHSLVGAVGNEFGKILFFPPGNVGK